MASGIAHELNNALTPILGYSDLITLKQEAGFQPGELEGFLKYIREAAQNAANIVRRMREFYRPRPASEPFVPWDLAELANEVLQLTAPMWRGHAQATGQAIVASLEALTTLPKVPLLVSELREALTNLVINACDAMPAGGSLSITLGRREQLAELTVTDTGNGMDQEVIRRCVEPFFTTKGTHGSGLGLAQVHGCVQRHGGRLEITSKPGQGSAFILLLPLHQAQPLPLPMRPSFGGALRWPLPPPVARAEPGSPPPATPAKAPLTGLRILLVDDDDAVRGTVAGLLQVDNHAITPASGGAQALATFDPARHQIVITDRAMADTSGDQLTSDLRARGATLPIIMLTGFGDLMLAANELPPGVSLVVAKPVTLEKLRTALHQVMADKPADR